VSAVGKVRIDQLLVARELAPSRARAQAMLLAGNVYVAGVRVDKAGALVAEDADVDVRGKSCLDLGASTGGFTDCLLQRGAARVVAVDVGYGQLAHKLRTDPRVVVRERTNARTLAPEDIGGAADLTVVDASFIGLAKLAEAIARCTRPGGEIVALVKPQFEVGREEASRGKGVVRDPEVRARAIDEAAAALRDAGLAIAKTIDCVLPGPKGNLEAFVFAQKPSGG